MKIGDVWYEKHTVTEISQRTNTVSEAQVEKVNAIPIPDNATNGDIIKAMFPNSEYEILYNTVLTDIDNGLWFTLDWWNAPYKTESEDKQ